MENKSFVPAVFAALFLLLSGCGPESWHYFSPAPMNFELQDSVLYLKFESDHYGSYKWTVTPSEPWIEVAPREGTNHDNVVFEQRVSVDKNLPPGLHSSWLEIDGEVVAESKYKLREKIKVLSHTGDLVTEFVITNDFQLDSLFDCADSNAASGLDLWGINREFDDTTINCVARISDGSRFSRWQRTSYKNS